MTIQAHVTATEALYLWACGTIPPATVHASLKSVGLKVDLRQPTIGALVEVEDILSGEYTWLEI